MTHTRVRLTCACGHSTAHNCPLAYPTPPADADEESTAEAEIALPYFHTDDDGDRLIVSKHTHYGSAPYALIRAEDRSLIESTASRVLPAAAPDLLRAIAAATGHTITIHSGDTTPDPSTDRLARAEAELDQLHAADTCRPIEVDGETISVRGTGEMNEEDRTYFAEVVRAAKRRYEAEHPPADAARLTASTITDTQLDALRARLAAEEETSRRLLAQRQEMAAERYAWQERGDRAESEADRLRRDWVTMRDRAEQAEAALERVRRLHHDYGLGDCAHCTGVDAAPWPCPTIQALDQPKDN
ncbi:hypothetical protein ACWF94_03650 [Streptomyces sp. NPDC055078]